MGHPPATDGLFRPLTHPLRSHQHMIKDWKTITAGLFFVAIGMIHAAWPQRVSIDWPTLALLTLGVALLFGHRISAALPYVKRLKLGEAEIEMREKLKDLRANVEQLEDQVSTRIGAKAAASGAGSAGQEEALETKILDLAVKDREAALIRLSMEIEKQLALLSQKVGTKAVDGTWRKTVDALLQAHAIESTPAKAIIEFRDVRNQVIHSGLRSPVKREITIRAIDDGLTILQYLKAATDA